MIKKFDNSRSPVARYEFESPNPLDVSGNGLHLTALGSPVVRAVYGRTLGLSPVGTLSRNGVSDAALRLYGDLTAMFLLVLRSAPSGVWLASFSASGETEPTNYLWDLMLVSQNSLQCFSEHGAGVDATPFVAAPAGKGLPAPGIPFFLALRQRAVPGGVVVQFFVNDEPFGDESPVIPAATGGTAAQLRINEGASSVFDLIAIEFDGAALTEAQLKAVYDDVLGGEFGMARPAVQSLVVGAVTDHGATVAVKLTKASATVRLAVTGPSGTSYSSVGETEQLAVQLSVTGLDAATAYSYAIEEDGVPLAGPTGSFTTLPTGNASFVVAFAGDAVSGSNAAVFDTIRGKAPAVFFHLGDMHYSDIAVNTPAVFHAAWDRVLAQSRQAQLYREFPLAYMWDDHDFGPNDSDASAPGRLAAAAVYRARFPHYALPDSVGIWQTFDIGRVRFILTDQRSAASAKGATDNSSKTMLGTAQKAWLKDLLSNSAGYLIVWVCPRWFGGPATPGTDNWGVFATERAELASHIHANCPGRVIVLSADLHALGIDDGSHHDFLPGGGEPLRTFQAAPLDITPDGGGMTYTFGPYTNNGQFGTMEVTDGGGSSLDVTWRGFNTGGTQLASLSFTVAL